MTAMAVKIKKRPNITRRLRWTNRPTLARGRGIVGRKLEAESPDTFSTKVTRAGRVVKVAIQQKIIPTPPMRPNSLKPLNEVRSNAPYAPPAAIAASQVPLRLERAD